MPGIRVWVDDANDPRLAPFRHLKRHNETRDAGLFVVEGEKLLERLVVSPFPVHSVLSTDRDETRVAPLVPEGVPHLVGPRALLTELAGYNFHAGVLGCGARRPWPGLETLLGSTGMPALLVVCPQIDNPENLGAITRIADVLGLVAVVAGRRCPDPLSRRVLRVSMGTALRTPVIVPDDLAATLRDLRARLGFSLAATVLDPAAEPIDLLVPPARLAVLLGSEGRGLDADWEALCDRRVTIPMRAGAESLNVAVAAGIVLHHARLSR